MGSRGNLFFEGSLSLRAFCSAEGVAISFFKGKKLAKQIFLKI